jgi:isopentenyl-diphosphate delta-isomerase
MSSVPSRKHETSPLDEVEYVTLVDDSDRTLGSCEKIEAHRAGKLHRAFSILITNPDGEHLLQRRASSKYHFAGRWSNACCGHPRPGEEMLPAAHRRLAEELGIMSPLEPVAELQYRSVDRNSGLIEHEYLHVLWGQCAGGLRPDPKEVGAVRWMMPNAIQRDTALHPNRFTPWFRLLIEQQYSLPTGSAPERGGQVTRMNISDGRSK